MSKKEGNRRISIKNSRKQEETGRTGEKKEMDGHTLFWGFCILVLGIVVGRLAMAVQVAMMKPKKKGNHEAERMKKNLEIIRVKEEDVRHKEEKMKQKEDELNNKILNNNGKYYVSITHPLHSQSYYHNRPFRKM